LLLPLNGGADGTRTRDLRPTSDVTGTIPSEHYQRVSSPINKLTRQSATENDTRLTGLNAKPQRYGRREDAKKLDKG